MKDTRRGKPRPQANKSKAGNQESGEQAAKRVKKIALPLVFLLLASFNASFGAEGNPLVDIHELDPDIKLELRYATTNNFVGEKLYAEARCLLRREVAGKLLHVQKNLEKRGLGLKIFDGYRPLSVQKKLWAKYPVEGFVANPAKGSNHNRGAAVDVTLVDAQGRELPMPSAYDEFSERAHRDYAGGTPEERRNRQTLEEAMEKEGFTGLKTEWWHFDAEGAKRYPVLDLPFDSVPKG
jgi:D-alanyl-D-alanine dipeptidase